MVEGANIAKITKLAKMRKFLAKQFLAKTQRTSHVRHHDPAASDTNVHGRSPGLEVLLPRLPGISPVAL